MKKRVFLSTVSKTIAGITLFDKIRENNFAFDFWLNPKEFVDKEAASEITNLHRWTDLKFEYQNDPYFGLWDTLSPASETIKTETGDCDDIACVAVSWLLKNQMDAYLVVSLTDKKTLHMVAHDGNVAYDSNEVKPIDEYYNEAMVYIEKKIN